MLEASPILYVNTSTTVSVIEITDSKWAQMVARLGTSEDVEPMPLTLRATEADLRAAMELERYVLATCIYVFSSMECFPCLANLFLCVHQVYS